jgi:hypothetical protein
MRSATRCKLEDVELCGYVCKKDSPSSGMTRVKVYNESGMAERVGAGLFTAAFMARFPLVPVEEEGRLHDARLREQGEKEEAERLLAEVHSGVRAGADAKLRAENKRVLSARAREREPATPGETVAAMVSALELSAGDPTARRRAVALAAALPRGERLTVVRVVRPLAAGGLLAVHQHVVGAAHPRVELLHAQALALPCPRRKRLAATEELRVVGDAHGHAGGSRESRQCNLRLPATRHHRHDLGRTVGPHQLGDCRPEAESALEAALIDLPAIGA